MNRWQQGINEMVWLPDHIYIHTGDKCTGWWYINGTCVNVQGAKWENWWQVEKYRKTMRRWQGDNKRNLKVTSEKVQGATKEKKMTKGKIQGDNKWRNTVHDITREPDIYLFNASIYFTVLYCIQSGMRVSTIHIYPEDWTLLFGRQKVAWSTQVTWTTVHC